MTGRVDGPPGIKHPSQVSRTKWKIVTNLVVTRDGGICWLCHHGGAKSADHIVPVSLGGEPWSMTNLKAVHHAKCPTCSVRCNLVARVPDAEAFHRARWVPWSGPKAPPKPEEPSFSIWQL